ncbi:GNAT family N-acetyltransferase, partial [Rheinheimera sp.]|uniref:GNAT family N-acetyltransferase n=1 Tax=Rheinheimera sp. TaxID=1869214 RepID=UPI0037C58BFC
MLKIPATERLHFALLSEQDAPLLFEVDQDAEVMRYINGGKLTSMQTIVEVMLPRMAQYRDAERGYGIWQVRRSADNVNLGWVLIRPMGFNTATPSSDDVEIGWRLKREYCTQLRGVA